MAMPQNMFSPTAIVTDFLEPDDRVRADPLVDYELGGIAVGDPSQGLQVQVWETRLDGNDIQIKPEDADETEWQTVTSDSDITEISLAFDQNMRPTVAFMAGGTAKLYWYDATIENYRTSTHAGATTPRVVMDDKRNVAVGLNDILLFYFLEGRIIHRLQRDRYMIAYDLAAVPSGSTAIRRCGMTIGNRIQVELNGFF